MKKTLFYSLVLMISLPAMASKKGNVLRGGYGFLFPDANQFVNAGQAALNKGVSAEANYSKHQETDSQLLTSSLAWANGSWAMGAAVTRSGDQLNDPSTSADVLTAQAGTSLKGGRVTLGGVYSKSLESGAVGDGVVSAQLNYHWNKPGNGWVMGLGSSTTLGLDTNTQTGTAALGYAFNGGMMLEGSYQVDDLSDTQSSYRYSAAAVYNSQQWYAAGQYNFVTLNGTNPDTVSGRLGVVLGQADLSAQVSKETFTGGETTYGGTLRLVF